MTPLVSILIPAYNSENWIAETLESALAQTWPRKEIIVIDDGSQDQTFAVAQKFADRGVKVVTQKNQGASAARNHAFALSRGDYIQWLDADDLLSPNKITRQIEVLGEPRNEKILISSGWASFLHQPSQAVFVPNALWHDLSRADWLINKMGQNLHMQTATWLVSRALTEKAGPWDSRLLVDDDGEYFCRVLLASERVKFVQGEGVYYRSAGSSSLSYIGRSKGKIEAQYLSMKIHIECLRSLEDSVRAREACVRYLQTWAIHFFPERMDIFSEAQKLAAELGGKLEEPSLSWKYSWIQKIFGWGAAKWAQQFAPRMRWSLARFIDRSLHRVRKNSGGTS